MNTDTKQSAHCSFTEVIKQLEPIDALILKTVYVYNGLPTISVRPQKPSDYTSHNNTIWGNSVSHGYTVARHIFDFDLLVGPSDPLSIANIEFSVETLNKLGLVNSISDNHFGDSKDSDYDKIAKQEIIENIKNIRYPKLKNSDPTIEFKLVKTGIFMTRYGRTFCDTCINDVIFI